jgi:hypothetical protein
LLPGFLRCRKTAAKWFTVVASTASLVGASDR